MGSLVLRPNMSVGARGHGKVPIRKTRVRYQQSTKLPTRDQLKNLELLATGIILRARFEVWRNFSITLVLECQQTFARRKDENWPLLCWNGKRRKPKLELRRIWGSIIW